MANDGEGLVYLANQGTVTFHVWTSRSPTLDRPDRMIFDLDPPEGDVVAARWAARRVGEILDELRLGGLPMTTGSKGYHVVVPLVPEATIEQVGETARAIAAALAARHQDRLTTEFRIAKREGEGIHRLAAQPLRPVGGLPVVGTPQGARTGGGSSDLGGTGRSRPDRWRLGTIGPRLADGGSVGGHRPARGAARRGLGVSRRDDRGLKSLQPPALSLAGRRSSPRRMSAPSTAESRDPARMRSWPDPGGAGSSKARPAMKMATVNPIPATAATPASDGQVAPLGELGGPDPHRQPGEPGDPHRLADDQPEDHPSVIGEPAGHRERRPSAGYPHWPRRRWAGPRSWSTGAIRVRATRPPRPTGGRPSRSAGPPGTRQVGELGHIDNLAIAGRGVSAPAAPI